MIFILKPARTMTAKPIIRKLLTTAPSFPNRVLKFKILVLEVSVKIARRLDLIQGEPAQCR